MFVVSYFNKFRGISISKNQIKNKNLLQNLSSKVLFVYYVLQFVASVLLGLDPFGCRREVNLLKVIKCLRQTSLLSWAICYIPQPRNFLKRETRALN